MHLGATTVKQRINIFARDDAGSSTIEAVLWLPVFVAFFCLVADASFLFFGQNKAYRIIQDANRTMSVGYLDSADAVEDYVRGVLSDYAPHAIVDSQIDLGQITTEVLIPGRDLVATGLFTAFIDLDIVARATHYIEY